MSQAMTDWLSALAAFRAEGQPCVMVTIAEVKGSAPRDSGTKMVVSRDRLAGSVGGGHLELKAIETARAMLAERSVSARMESFGLGPHLGQCCGGRVALLFEPFNVETPMTVAIFGSGHVGKALVQILAGLPLRVRLIDARAEQFPATLPDNVERTLTDHVEDEVPDLPIGAYCLVMTHSHDLDLAVCERLIRRGDCAYVGVIGSASKWRRFEARLLAKGLPPEAVAAVRCPIGIDGIEGKHPHEIAVAVAAELLLRRDAMRHAAASAGAGKKALGPA
ncbi:MAG TPA: xanthine dehydrogenase accessory protein XdhC [Alphaproteobacteria bacterium]|nr:xanthine dehydrogenase accessory protein XdhC [Alphaproteobacteria bacterium]